jgi:hypothetical protein
MKLPMSDKRAHELMRLLIPQFTERQPPIVPPMLEIEAGLLLQESQVFA